jgi:hypothetical protein
MVFDDGLGYTQKVISGQGMRDDKYTRVRAMCIEELDCETDKIVSVTGYKTSALRRGPVHLLNIRSLQHSNLVSAYSIYMILSEYFCDFRAEVLIEIVFQ